MNERVKECVRLAEIEHRANVAYSRAFDAVRAAYFALTRYERREVLRAIGRDPDMVPRER